MCCRSSSEVQFEVYDPAVGFISSSAPAHSLLTHSDRTGMEHTPLLPGPKHCHSPHYQVCYISTTTHSTPTTIRSPMCCLLRTAYLIDNLQHRGLWHFWDQSLKCVCVLANTAKYVACSYAVTICTDLYHAGRSSGMCEYSM